jgi:hypothetical protein
LTCSAETATTTVATAAVATTTVALAACGQAVNAGAGGVGLATGLDGLAAWQVQLGKLRGLERVNVARQFIVVAGTAITVLVAVLLPVGVTLAALATLALTFRARAARVLRAILALALAVAVAT